jgi:hypothetical protein
MLSLNSGFPLTSFWISSFLFLDAVVVIASTVDEDDVAMWAEGRRDVEILVRCCDETACNV